MDNDNKMKYDPETGRPINGAEEQEFTTYRAGEENTNSTDPTINPEIMGQEYTPAVNPADIADPASAQNAQDFAAKYQEAMNPVGSSSPGSAVGGTYVNQTAAFQQRRMDDLADQAQAQAQAQAQQTAAENPLNQERPQQGFQGYAQGEQNQQGSANLNQQYYSGPGTQNQAGGQSSYQSPNYGQYKVEEAQPSQMIYVALTLAIISLVMLILPQSWFFRPIIAIVALVISIIENKKQQTKLGRTTFILSVVSLAITLFFFVACLSCIGCGLANFHRFSELERFMN